jgi:hypothetical protein
MRISSLLVTNLSATYSWNSPENTTAAIEISFLELMSDYFLSQLKN